MATCFKSERRLNIISEYTFFNFEVLNKTYAISSVKALGLLTKLFKTTDMISIIFMQVVALVIH